MFTTELLKLSEAFMCRIAFAVSSFPRIVKRLSGAVVPMPILPELLTNKSAAPLVFAPVTFNVPRTFNVCAGVVVPMAAEVAASEEAAQG